jgi:thiol-disulfide isomerase/thioredoxin
MNYVQYLTIGLLSANILVHAAATNPEPVSTPSTTQKKKAQRAESNLIVLSSEAQFNELINSGDVIVVVFSTTWCGYCKTLADTLNKVMPEYPNITFVKVDGDTFGALAKKYHVSAYPTGMVFKNGKKGNTFSGGQSATALRTFLNNVA